MNDTASNPTAAPAQGALAGKRILMVEDDKFLTELLVMKLMQEGATVFHASEGGEALRIGDEEKELDIALLDIVLPGMDGFAILEELRKRDQLKKTPIIILSNLGQPEDNERAQKLGADKFLVKAMLTPDQIVAEVREMLAK